MHMGLLLGTSISTLIFIVIIIPLFTLGSICSTNASGAGQINETNNLNQT